MKKIEKHCFYVYGLYDLAHNDSYSFEGSKDPFCIYPIVGRGVCNHWRKNV